MTPRRIAALLAASVFGCAARASAQAIVGAVAGDGAGAPVAAAEVEALGANGRAAARARTDEKGAFTLPLREPGVYRVRTSRIGYQPATSDTVTVGAGETVHVRSRLSAAAVAITPLTVTARTQPARSTRLEREGFYERQRMGFGVFRTREEIMRRLPTRTSELARGIAGVAVVPGQGTRWTIFITRTGARCVPKIVVDNLTVGMRDLDSVIQPQDVQGIEVYRGPSEVPARYMGGGSVCGLILIWSRIGEPEPQPAGS
ncbi:MAG TPA: carboxypeptidase regulatory-like domain-containing protein [Longimicrobium sp.]